MARFKVAIVDVGMSDFKFHREKGPRELILDAYNEAMANTGLTNKDIDGVVFGSMMAGHEDEQMGIAAPFAVQLGLRGKSVIRVESVCATGGAAVRVAASYIQAGIHDVLLAIGFDKQNVATPRTVQDYARIMDPYMDTHVGLSGPSFVALMEKNYLKRYPHAREEDFNLVSAKNHTYGLDHPHAGMGMKMTLEDVKKYPYIATPIRLCEITPLTDGAACVILCRPELVKEFTKKPPIYLIGTGMAGSDDSISTLRDEVGVNESVREAGRQAYKMAGIEPKDIDVAEVYDCYTYLECLYAEELGFFEPGEAVIATREGRTRREGQMPLNVTGGNQSRGHPPGATGVAQAWEIVRQLREEGGRAQVPKKNMRFGLTSSAGGGYMRTAVCNILVREG